MFNSPKKDEKKVWLYRWIAFSSLDYKINVYLQRWQILWHRFLVSATRFQRMLDHLNTLERVVTVLAFNSIFTVMTFHFSCLLLVLTFTAFFACRSYKSKTNMICRDEKAFLGRCYASCPGRSVDKLNFRLKRFSLHDVAPPPSDEKVLLIINLLYGYFGFFLPCTLMILIHCNDLANFLFSLVRTVDSMERIKPNTIFFRHACINFD